MPISVLTTFQKNVYKNMNIQTSKTGRAAVAPHLNLPVKTVMSLEWNSSLCKYQQNPSLIGHNVIKTRWNQDSIYIRRNESSNHINFPYRDVALTKLTIRKPCLRPYQYCVYICTIVTLKVIMISIQKEDKNSIFVQACLLRTEQLVTGQRSF